MLKSDIETSLSKGNYHSTLMTVAKSDNMRMFEPSMPSAKRARKGRSRICRNSDENMDHDIWKALPEDLLESVIARLPIAAFFRFRLVCKKWNMLLSSQSFYREYAQKKQQSQPWFYMFTHHNLYMGSMYNSFSRRWYHPQPASLISDPTRLPVASAGGLICFLDCHDKSFYIYNPLTRSCKALPRQSIFVQSRISVGMTLNGHSQGYNVLWVGVEGVYEIYDSTKNEWSRPGKIPSTINLPLELNLKSQAVCINRTLYFIRTFPDGVVSYNMETGVWEQLDIPVPRHSSDQTLAECNGKIMLVGLLKKYSATCVCIWELQKMTLLWKEVDRMPNLWLFEFYGKHVKMTCLGNKGLLMLSLKSQRMNQLVTYDMTSQEWMKVTLGRKAKFISSGTAFLPCLTALP